MTELLLVLTATITSSSSSDIVNESINPTSSTPPPQTDEVDIDLRHGIVKGYSRYVRFISPLSHPSSEQDSPPAAAAAGGGTSSPGCAVQTVISVDLVSGPFNRLRLHLDYERERPRLWTLDLSDSSAADGYGSTTAAPEDLLTRRHDLADLINDSMAEVQVYYDMSNELESYFR